MVGSKKSSKKRKLSRSERDKKIIAKLKRIHTRIRKRLGTPKCKKNEIVREGYIKKLKNSRSKITVPPTCIKDRGNKGKGKQLFRLNKGTLSQFGYSDVMNKTKADRQKLLKRAVSHIEPLAVFRKLIAVSTLNKTTNPQLAKRFRDDAEWVRDNF